MPAKFFLLDAHALLYRAHFALLRQPRRNPQGLDTSAIYGFANTLLEVLAQEQPTHLAVAFDTATPTFRHQAFADYKAQRQAQPEGIATAIPLVQRLLEAFRIPMLSVPGYEADDIIGTLAQQAAGAGVDVYMMTPDKDFGQLVGPHCYLYKPAKLGYPAEIWDEARVKTFWCVEQPQQVVDILALQGDASDNIPGVRGIGPKTARKLIQQFHSLEGVLSEASTLSIGKVREALLAHQAEARLSRRLATIDTQVPLDLTWKDCHYEHNPDEQALALLFHELAFRSLAKRLALPDVRGIAEGKVVSEEVQPIRPQVLATLATTPHQYQLVDDLASCQALAARMQQRTIFAFDTETSGLNVLQCQLLGLSIAYTPNEAHYVSLPKDKAQAMTWLKVLQPAFANPECRKVAHHLKFDLHVLQRYGLTVAPPHFDTLLAHHLTHPDTSHGLDDVARTLLQYEPTSYEVLLEQAEVDSITQVPIKQLVTYACEDADVTLRLARYLAPILEAQGQDRLFYDVEMPLVPVLVAMEAIGIKVCPQQLQQLSATFNKALRELADQIHTTVGYAFNIDSPKQLGEALFEGLQLAEKPRRTKSGQYATSEQILAQLATQHPVVQHVLEYRALRKLKNTYADALPSLISAKDGCIHTSYNQAIVTSGRLSSSHPNLQNIPIRTPQGRAIRAAFVPRAASNVLLAADYSQIELRIMAAFARDQAMLKAFAAQQDIHTATASQVFQVTPEAVTAEMRRRAKMVNFGIIFGISPYGLGQRLGISRSEAAAIIDRYFAQFPEIKAYMDQLVAGAEEQGYVTTLLGRRRYLPDIRSRNATVRGFAARNAINTPIQGTAAELMKAAMIRVAHWLQKQGLRTRLLLQVHDELVLEVPRTELDQVRTGVPLCMEQALDVGVPLKVEVAIGPNWEAAHA